MNPGPGGRKKNGAESKVRLTVRPYIEYSNLLADGTETEILRAPG